MADGPWITAGAPLPDGWRVWYSWPGEPVEPPPPRVRAPGGAELAVDATFELLPAVDGSARRMAIHELRPQGAQPGALHEVTFDGLAPLYWRTRPQVLAPEGMSFLVGSCFWLNDDKAGFYAAAVQELVQREQPVFKILMGDQLYADVWPPSPDGVRRGIAAKYERYWGDAGYQALLRACPTFVTNDDHEFWNDYPEPQVQVPLSWPKHSPESDPALHDFLDLYQTALNPEAKRWCRFDIAPVSFFIADTRSHRTRSELPTPSLMVDEQWADLEAWAAALAGPGVLVLPQPMMKAGGSKTDRCYADFLDDYGRLGDLFVNSGHDILILTGDIHTGRLSRATIVGAGRDVYELVASPGSLVTPFLPPWGHDPNPLPASMLVGRHKWDIFTTQLTATVDNNVGLVRMAPGRDGSTRFTLQLWRVRPFQGVGTRIFHRAPAKGAQPINDPIELELR